MARNRRVNIKAILGDPDLRRKLMVSTIQATQAREGIDTSPEQADRAYYVVTEAERATFFDLERFRGAKRGERDARHEMFVKALAGEDDRVRYSVPRREFSTIKTSPLVYRDLNILAHLFRDNPATASLAEAYQGVITGSDEPFFRYFWEVAPRLADRPWVPLHKGGNFSRFYYDADLVIDWTDTAQQTFHRLRDPRIYFKPGLTWPRRTAKGFNIRILPAGCIFADKGPALFARQVRHNSFLLGVMNSRIAEYILQSLTSFSWEIGVIKRLPIPQASGKQMRYVSQLAQSIHDAKHEWDRGNELSTSFECPWVLRTPDAKSFSHALDSVLALEVESEEYIQTIYNDLNIVSYRLYGIPEATRAHIEWNLGDRPPEVIWPQMEGKSNKQKRMEHVWRLLSYTVKRVVEADGDGIVPFTPLSGETTLLDRVHDELAALFPVQDVNQVEVEIANELKRRVKGYKRASSIGEWLDNIYFDYHATLYKKRPIIWHIASSQGSSSTAFGALCHYHKFDANCMAKLRAGYLRDAIEAFRREAALADREGRTEDRIEWQGKLEETQALDRRLQAVQEGYHEGGEGRDCDYRILTPWKSPEDRPKGWTPDINDGVKVNIEPLQKAGVLRIRKVV